MPGYGQCPRCGGGSLEYLATHSHCWECNYFPEDNQEMNRWRGLEFRMSSFASQLRREDQRALHFPFHRRSMHLGGQA
jgi:hypothetical protein